MHLERGVQNLLICNLKVFWSLITIVIWAHLDNEIVKNILSKISNIFKKKFLFKYQDKTTN